MPQQLYAFRLPPETVSAIHEMAAIYGAPNSRSFVRDMLGAMTSGDIERINEFNGRLMRGIGEQLILQLTTTPAQATAVAVPVPLVPRKPARRVKARKRRQTPRKLA